MKPKKLELMPFGLTVSFKLDTKDYNEKILKANLLELKKAIISLSGPITNLIMILIFCYFDLRIIEKNIAIYSNFLIILFNLLPIYPLDGGRILKSIVHILVGGKTARVVANRVANIAILMITVIGSIAVFYFENISIFLIIMFLWWLVINENKRQETIIKAYNML